MLPAVKPVRSLADISDVATTGSGTAVSGFFGAFFAGLDFLAVVLVVLGCSVSAEGVIAAVGVSVSFLVTLIVGVCSALALASTSGVFFGVFCVVLVFLAVVLLATGAAGCSALAFVDIGFSGVVLGFFVMKYTIVRMNKSSNASVMEALHTGC